MRFICVRLKTGQSKTFDVAAYMLYTYKVKINMYHFTYAKNTMTAV